MAASTKMNRLLLLIFALLCITSCGGISGGVASSSMASATLTVHWPEHPTRMIHDRADKVEGDISFRGSFLVHAFTMKPSNGNTSTLKFTNLPADADLTLDVWAEDTTLKDSSGKAIHLSGAKPTFKLKPGPNSLDITLETKTTIIEISGAPTSPMQVGDQAQLSAVAKNAEGYIVLTTPDSFVWNSTNSQALTVDSFGKVIATGNGTSIISALEKGNETQNAKSGQVAITVGTANGTYTVQDLGALGGANCEAMALNDSGVVVGKSDLAPGNPDEQHGFKWSNGVMTDLQRFGWMSPELRVPTEAIAINNSGMVIGKLFAPGSWKSIIIPPSNGQVFTSSLPNAILAMPLFINNAGDMAGLVGLSTGGSFPVTWQAGTETDLSLLFPRRLPGQARSLNSQGKVIFVLSDSGYASFLWEPGKEPVQIGADGTERAEQINDSDEVVGYRTKNGNVFPFKWSNGVISDIPTPNNSPGLALCLNNSGLIGGYYFAIGNATAYISDGIISQNVNDLVSLPGWHLFEVVDINSSGQLLCQGQNSTNHNIHSFLLTPN